MFPIYAMEMFDNFVYLGGGGGMELKNVIVGYRMQHGNPVLTQVVHTESTDKAVANYMTVPRDVSTPLPFSNQG